MPNTLLEDISQLEVINLIMENSKELIWVIDKNKRLLLANKAFIETVNQGASKRVKTGDSLSDIGFPNEYIQFWQTNYNKCFNNEYFSVESFAQWNGESHYFRNHLTPLKNHKDEIIAVFCTAINITEEKKAEEINRAQINKYQYLYDNMAQGVVFQDKTGKIISYNNAALEILGLTADQITGRSSYDPDWKAIKENGEDFPGEEHPAIITLKTGKEVLNVIMGVFHPKEEKYRWILVSSKPFYTDIENKAYLVFATFTDITELKNTEKNLAEIKILEEQLSQSHENFNSFFNTINDYLFVLDENANVIYHNDAVSKKLKYKNDELIGQSVLSVHPTERQEEAMQIVQAMLEFKTDCCDVPLITKEGDLIPVETYVTRGEWNNKPVIYGISKDISKLKLSEEKFSKMFNKHNAVMLLINPNTGNIVDSNTSAEEYYGYSKEVFCTMNIDQISTSSKSSILDLMKKAKEEKSNHFIFSHRLANQNLRKVEVHSSPINVNNQDLLFSIIFDVTDKINAEENLSKERIRLANIIDSTKIGTWEWNIQTDEAIFNERWAEICGYTLSELEPTDINTWVNMAHPGDLEESNKRLNDHFCKKTDFYEIECRMKHKNGNWVWVTDKGQVIKWNEDGLPLMMVGTHQDISDRKKMEEMTLLENQQIQLRKFSTHLQSALEEERSFISRELHDNLGQSLTALRLNLFQLRKMKASNLDHEIEAIIHLVDDTITQTREISKKIRPPMLDNLGLISAVEWHLNELAKSSSISFSIEKNIDEVKISKSKSIEIYRIIQEALTNVIRHSKATHAIVKFQQINKYLEVAIIDNGIGIEEDEISQLKTLGILGITERASILKANLKIYGNKKAGTVVKLSINHK